MHVYVYVRLVCMCAYIDIPQFQIKAKLIFFYSYTIRAVVIVCM